jgi:hypothetical protein
MSADLVPAGGPPPVKDPISPEEVNGALWNALLQAATKSGGAQDPRDAKEYADATFALAQAITMLDRGVISPQGVHPEVLKASMPNRPDSPEASVTPNTGKGKGPS